MSGSPNGSTDQRRSNLPGRRLLRQAGTRLLETELQSLVAAYQRTHDARLESRLVEANLGLVIKIARQLDRSRGRQLDDLVQEGCLGLITAVRRFDSAKGASLSTYAGFWIRAYIMRNIIDNVRVVRVVRTRGERVAFFRGELGGAEVPFDSATGHEGRALSETLPGAGAAADAVIETAELTRRVKREASVLEGRLHAREATILRERLLADEPRPLRELGKRLSLSGERVRQIEETLRAAIRQQLGDGFAVESPAAAA